MKKEIVFILLNKIRVILICGLLFGSVPAFTQAWQQRVDYTMTVDLDDKNHRYTGTQELWYFNNSPDTLDKVFYHLYYNAFQPGSVMDHAARNMLDPDRNLQRIAHLTPEEQGWLRVLDLKQDGQGVNAVENGTILEVTLAYPIIPGDSTLLSHRFHGQIPVLVRRAGRNNTEGIDYSMAQWYPKVCAYDQDGWHPNPYIGREFYADFGNFDVTISIDARYTVAASGLLQNADKIGRGYERAGTAAPSPGDGKLQWHFRAERVHDFTWAADPDYVHTSLQRDDGIDLHFFAKKNPRYDETWEALPEIMDHALTFINARFGQYPYPVYTFAQGGDRGMEYAMITLITTERSLRSLVGVAVHEILHSWYHMILATNESLYAWLDEGFVEYAEEITMVELERAGFLPSSSGSRRQGNAYQSYYRFLESRLEEPMSTHADHFISNVGYAISTYSKGHIFLKQLEYIIGDEAMGRTMLRYFNTWKFHHPRPLDFIRIAEKESGMVLDWYYEYWILGTKTIDYSIAEVTPDGGNTEIRLRREGFMPMPVEVQVTTRKGEQETWYIPLDLMRGEKVPDPGSIWVQLEDWQVTSRDYAFLIPTKLSRIEKIEIDARGQIADVDRQNNVYYTGDED